MTKRSLVLLVSAKNCPQFRGPDNKAEFKTEMLEVLRTTKQRFGKLLKKSQPTAEEEVDEGQQNLLQEIKRLEKLIARQSSDDELVHEEAEADENFDADGETDSEGEEEENLGVYDSSD